MRLDFRLQPEILFYLAAILQDGKAGDFLSNIENIISIENLSYSYKSEDGIKTEVLKNVSLKINKGEFITILGHNGSGKSTLAKHLNAILVPDGGSVTVLGMDTSDESNLLKIRQNVGMVFQNPDNQIVATIVEEDVAFAPENLGIPSDEIRERVDYALNAVGMTEFKNHAPHLLSGGQKQRIAIAGILAMKPAVIVLDEATAMLDPSGRNEIMNTVKKLNKEEGITVVHITHYMEEAAVSDRVVVIDSGEIVMDDSPEKIFSRVEELKKIGLDVPQPTLLIHYLNKEGYRLNKNILSIEDCAEEISLLYKKLTKEQG